MKTNRVYKDQYPEIYGYRSLEALRKNYKGDYKYYTTYIDENNDTRFIPCSKEIAFENRNIRRNEERVHNKEESLVALSLEEFSEEYNLEFPSISTEQEIAEDNEKNILENVLKYISEYKIEDQKILILHFNGYSDEKIGQTLRKSRSTIQERKSKLINDLKRNAKNFF